jgi:acetylornithine deacetylase/succinyl-diaminopimelate desuccinylase-like protein
VAGARKGSGNYAVVFSGRAAHVGRDFTSGRSALLAAADFALRLDQLNAQVEGVTFNTGAIEGGAPVNMVPPGAVLRFNVRAPDAEAAAWAQAKIAETLAAVSTRDGIAVTLHGVGGQRHDGQTWALCCVRLPAFPEPDLACSFVAIDIWHLAVHEHQIVGVCGGSLHAVFAATCHVDRAS